MKVRERKSDLGRVEPGSVFIKTAFLLLQMVEKLAAIHELHDHIQTLLVLEGELQAHYERMIKLFQDFTLNSDAVNLILPDDLLLYHWFHCEHLVCMYVLDQVDLSIGASSDRSYNLEVTLLHRGTLRRVIFRRGA